ncbi:MAG: PIG-L family deacetylase [Acidobacteriota bacterium]|nr:PIG-L family deacetylase [Acidobacteriota bacterium]
MKRSVVVIAGALLGAVAAGAVPAGAQDAPLRIIAFGAHPDDNELKVAGTAAKWAALGHQVKFVAVTNGDIGHWREAGGPLARRRIAESNETAKIMGITMQVLDIHDGELEPTLENRRTITRLIREWKADIVLGHRTNDYHPDHRAVGQLIQDASYMVTVPFFAPDAPHLARNPVFLFYQDGFTTPNPFQPDVVVAIDDVLEKKLAAVEALPSQFYEGGANGGTQLVPSDEAGKTRRKTEVRESFTRRFTGTATQYRAKLVELYGKERGDAVKTAEAFMISEYGRRPNAEEIKRLFPFFSAK